MGERVRRNERDKNARSVKYCSDWLMSSDP